MTDKVLYIIRGLPGAGKSTIGEKLCGKAHCHSNDDYFVDPDGSYHYRPKYMANAIWFCRKNVAVDLQAGIPAVAVANVFCDPDHEVWFKRQADKYGYKVVEIVVRSEFENVHKVHQSRIAAMHMHFNTYQSVFGRAKILNRVEQVSDMLPDPKRPDFDTDITHYTSL